MMKSAAVVSALALSAQATGVEESSRMTANPIRKVVTMLQNIQKKVEKEGESEKKLFEKYMCYCKGGADTLEQGIAASDAKIPEVEAAITAAEAQKKQLDEDLAAHRSDREEAKSAMDKATALRNKEAKTYADYKAEMETNVAAIDKAVKSLESGMAGSFLQTPSAAALRSFVQMKAKISDVDRDDVMAFLTASEGYAPQSGEITGILKTMGEEMSKDLADATATENGSIKSYDELMAAKEKEVEALTAAIEDKTVRSGEVAVSVVEMKNDLSDTEAALVDDKKFLADLEKNCKTKEAEWAEIEKSRSEELVALSETIKLLNDDDALELFKKTLPSAASSFMQVQMQSSEMRSKAMSIIRSAQKKGGKDARQKLDFILLALHGKMNGGFDKVIGMIDTMVDVLKKEQVDDDDKKEYCEVSFDSADDKKKGLEVSIKDSEKAMADAEEGIATLTNEIKALTAGVKELDKSVVEATEQRQKENKEFQELMASNTAAVDLIGLAKNRLNKFYNPALYKPPPKRELSEEDRIAVNMGGTAPPTPAPGGIAGTGITAFAEIRAHSNMQDAPAPPPEAPKAFEKKSEESNGVIAMMDLLIKDLEKEMQVAETAEKDAQADYEQMSEDAKEKRAADVQLTAEKESAKAENEGALQRHFEAKASANKELMATLEFISGLHGECDWLVQNYDARTEARAAEVESLKKAKAVLSGADYSLLQTARSLKVRRN